MFYFSKPNIQLPQDWGNRLLEGTTKPCAHQDPGERSNDSTKDWARLACESPGVAGRGVGQQWPSAGLGTVTAIVWEPQHAGISPFDGGRHYPNHSWASGQTTGKEHSLTHQQTRGLKIYWAWPCSPELGPVLPTASASHQEASSSLLSSSIRGPKEWKPQSQETNQNDHKDHRFV